MAYSELVKNFERVRDYMRQFFVFGFKTRNEFDKKSSRSYDNEKRRIESWLGDYMSFKYDDAGKNVFLSVDSRNIKSNPLYNAFKAKSFTTGDIAFHFYILDILADGSKLSIREIMDIITEEYFYEFPDAEALDESTIRKKLKEYVQLGLLCSEKEGKELKYYRTTDAVDLQSWKDATAFYAEENPIGVIGSFIEDKYDDKPDYFGFKHHYIMHALDSDILCNILLAIQDKKKVSISVIGRRHPDKENTFDVFPIKIYISTQTGRQYLLAYEYRFNSMTFFRLDSIHAVKVGDFEPRYEKFLRRYELFKDHAWGTAKSFQGKIDHLEMTIFADENEGFIVDRLNREKRNGTVEDLGENIWKYSVDCYDATEMIPWIRTFTGRIVKLECSNERVLEIVYGDLNTLYEMYGGEDDAV